MAMDTSPRTFDSSHRFNKAIIVVTILEADCWWRATQIEMALWSAKLEEEHDSGVNEEQRAECRVSCGSAIIIPNV